MTPLAARNSMYTQDDQANAARALMYGARASAYGDLISGPNEKTPAAVRREEISYLREQGWYIRHR